MTTNNRILRLTIPDIPPSLNKFVNKMHHFARAKEKQDWETQVGWAVKAAGWRGPAMKRAVVTITYYFPNRIRRDPDNYSGKWVIDGLRKAEVLEDDSFHNVELRLKAGVDRKRPRTEIEVTEVGESEETGT